MAEFLHCSGKLLKLCRCPNAYGSKLYIRATIVYQDTFPWEKYMAVLHFLGGIKILLLPVSQC